MSQESFFSLVFRQQIFFLNLSLDPFSSFHWIFWCSRDRWQLTDHFGSDILISHERAHLKTFKGPWHKEEIKTTRNKIATYWDLFLLSLAFSGIFLFGRFSRDFVLFFGRFLTARVVESKFDPGLGTNISSLLRCSPNQTPDLLTGYSFLQFNACGLKITLRQDLYLRAEKYSSTKPDFILRYYWS